MAEPVKAYIDPSRVTQEMTLDCYEHFNSLSSLGMSLIAPPIVRKASGEVTKMITVMFDCAGPLDIPASCAPEIALRQTFTPVYEDRSSSKKAPSTPRIFPPIYLSRA